MVDYKDKYKTLKYMVKLRAANASRVSPRLGGSMDVPLFFFDFDLTLTLEHSGGEPEPSVGTVIELFSDYDSPNAELVARERVESLLKLFEDIRSRGGLVYICTRGLKKEIGETMDIAAQFCRGGSTPVVGKGNLIEEVLGANNVDEIADPFYRETDTSTEDWALKKKELIQSVVQQHNTPTDLVYFFDDTRINIEVSKNAGFKNAEVITDPRLLNEIVRRHLPR